jgi:hypothetical protein
VYNAHLEVVHTSVNAERNEEEKKLADGDGGVSYASFGGPVTGVVASQAEEAQVSKRVCSRCHSASAISPLNANHT